MLINQTIKNGAAVLSLSGRLDFNARTDFQTAIQKAKDSHVPLIVLNMKDVSFIDSAALGLMTVAFKNLEASKIRFVIADAQDYVQKVFTLANLGNIITIYPSVEEAITSRNPVVSHAIR